MAAFFCVGVSQRGFGTRPDHAANLIAVHVEVLRVHEAGAKDIASVHTYLAVPQNMTDNFCSGGTL